MSKHSANRKAREVASAHASIEGSPRTRAASRKPARRRAALAGSAHVTLAGGNVFADLGFPAAEAENLKIRSFLMGELHSLITARRLTQVVAAEIFGISQPRVSDLVRGKIGLFTIDSLVNMLTHAGVGIRVTLV